MNWLVSHFLCLNLNFRIKDELQDKVDIPLIDLDLAVCADGLLNLVITGQATPYVHNSWAFVNGVSIITKLTNSSDGFTKLKQRIYKFFKKLRFLVFNKFLCTVNVNNNIHFCVKNL